MNKWYKLGKEFKGYFEGERELNEFLRNNGMNFEPYSFEDFTEENYKFLCKYVGINPVKDNFDYDRGDKRYCFIWFYRYNYF